MTGPNGAGNREPAGVFARVRRDRQIANLLYGLLGAEDERDPQGALASLATSAAATLDVCGPEYRVRVIRALQLLTGLVLDSAERAMPPIEFDLVPIPMPSLDDPVDAPATFTLTRTDEAPPLIDPDCAAGKCGSCVGGPCEHDCHPEPGSGKSAAQQYLQHAVVIGPHPFEPAADEVHNCATCGQPSVAVEHFTPTGLLNAPAVVAVDPAPADVHPVTDSARCPICGVLPGDMLGHTPSAHEAAGRLIPCPTCGVLPPQHTPACADQDDETEPPHGGHTWGVLGCKACADQDAG